MESIQTIRKCQICERWFERDDVLRAFNDDPESETYSWCPWCERGYLEANMPNRCDECGERVGTEPIKLDEMTRNGYFIAYHCVNCGDLRNMMRDPKRR